MTSGRRALTTVLQLGLLALSAALVGRIVVTADLRRVGELIATGGFSVFLAFIPSLAAVSVDTAGWNVILAGLGHRLPHLGLLRLRLSTEAVLLSAPFGTVGAESLKAYLLERRYRVPVSDAIATITTKKTLLTLALGAYLLTSAWVGRDHLVRASTALLGRNGLPVLVAAAGVLLVVLALALFRSMRWLSGRWRRLAAIDGQLGRLAADRGRLARAGATFYLGWLVEACESFILLKVVGADISFAQLIALEASVSLIRSLAIFAPAGLGVQDWSYLGFFAAVGVPDAANVGAAFLVLKRAKELFWVVAGYFLLVADGARAQVAARAKGARPRVLFICGTVHQTQQMRKIHDAFGGTVEGWFTPYYCDGYLRIFRALRLLEMTIAGHKLQARCRAELARLGLPIDERGRRGGYDLVVTCSDILVQKNVRGLPLVAVQEGMTDPENFLFRLYRRFPMLFPRWLPGTSTTVMSGLYDKMCVASPGYKEHFVNKGADPARLEVTGIPNLDDCERYRQNDLRERGYVLVCTSDTRETMRADNRRAFLAKAAEIAAGRPLVFKLHPNERAARSIREIRAVAPDAPIHTSGCAEELIANCDVLICQYSTTAYVGLALGKEVHSYFDVDELRRLMPLQNGGTSARAIAEVCRRLLAADVEPEPVATVPALAREAA